MIETSVDAQAPPGQDRPIGSWGTNIRLVDLGRGQAAVTMLAQGFRREVARVSYGTSAATSTVRWNNAGLDALEQYKRDALDSKIYKEIAVWLRGPS
jgi:hypothetical protein